MSTNTVWDLEFMEKEFKSLVNKCRELMNEKFLYAQAYDLAVQAKYVAEYYLNNDFYMIECEMLRGLAQLGVDKITGHEILNKLYYESEHKVKNTKLEIRLKNSLGVAKRQIQEYEEAISLLCEVLELGQKEVQKAKEEGRPIDTYIVGLTYCLNNITISLIHMCQQKYYPSITRLNEKRFKEMGLDSIEEIKREFDRFRVINKNNIELEEAKKYIGEALKMCEDLGLKDLHYYSLLNYACILSEEENYLESLKVLESIATEPYVVENMLGNVFNEIGINHIKLNNFEKGYQILTSAWDWLTKRNDMNELNRNLYATALYHYSKDNLDMAYAFAEIAYSRDFNVSCLRLLYQISCLKYMQARKYGNDAEYALYRSEYGKYKEKLERRL